VYNHWQLYRRAGRVGLVLYACIVTSSRHRLTASALATWVCTSIRVLVSPVSHEIPPLCTMLAFPLLSLHHARLALSKSRIVPGGFALTCYRSNDFIGCTFISIAALCRKLCGRSSDANQRSHCQPRVDMCSPTVYIVRSRWHSFECGDVSYRLALPLINLPLHPPTVTCIF